MNILARTMGETITKRFGELSPNRILREIVESSCRYSNYTFIVMGRPGPTGKTWLTACLQTYGFNAVELSERLIGIVEYMDNNNHIIESNVNKTITIVLNKRFGD